jgi:hypothetical protein
MAQAGRGAKVREFRAAMTPRDDRVMFEISCAVVSNWGAPICLRGQTMAAARASTAPGVSHIKPHAEPFAVP